VNRVLQQLHICEAEVEFKTFTFPLQVTPVVPLSNDSWSMSFAKYLELRFYGHQYTRRANAEPCGHSIHKDYHQYFSYNQMVASFRYPRCHSPASELQRITWKPAADSPLPVSSATPP